MRIPAFIRNLIPNTFIVIRISNYARIPPEIGSILA